MDAEGPVATGTTSPTSDTGKTTTGIAGRTRMVSVSSTKSDSAPLGEPDVSETHMPRHQSRQAADVLKAINMRYTTPKPDASAYGSADASHTNPSRVCGADRRSPTGMPATFGTTRHKLKPHTMKSVGTRSPIWFSRSAIQTSAYGSADASHTNPSRVCGADRRSPTDKPATPEHHDSSATHQASRSKLQAKSSEAKSSEAKSSEAKSIEAIYAESALNELRTARDLRQAKSSGARSIEVKSNGAKASLLHCSFLLQGESHTRRERAQ